MWFVGGLGMKTRWIWTALAAQLGATVPAQANTVTLPAISAEQLSADVQTLSSDAFQGRAPGTPGEQATLDWLIGTLREIGLQPGGRNGSWTQPVPLVRTQITGGTITVRTGDQTAQLRQGADIYVSTVRPVDQVAIAQAPMVFVGYGVTAPEQGWDDFKTADLSGKVAIFLVNDPDFEATPADDAHGRFGGQRMTYYGRWTYKYEEAARRGAIAALIIHDTPGAGYGWATVVAPGGENYDIVRADPASRILLQGWIEGAAATRLFAASGLDLAALRLAARRSDFQPVELTGQRLSSDLTVSHSQVESHNILARLPGTTRADEIIAYGAHWDAYGVGQPAADGSTIRAGANDDAAGVAGLLAIARALKAGPPLPRTVTFSFWTAEERGLLGSEAYAVDPIDPFAKTVANITLDIMQTGGPSRDVLLVGAGQNGLDALLRDAAGQQGRAVTPEALPERGLNYRADHFSFARRGVPSLLFMAISGAPDLVNGGRAGGEAWLRGYMACYHQTCDRWTPAMDFRGVAADVGLALTVGRSLAQTDQWPQWADGTEFAAIRRASRAGQ